MAKRLREVAEDADALIVLEQVDLADTGVVTSGLLGTIAEIAASRPDLPIMADSRRGLAGWPPLSFKMNAVELQALLSAVGEPSPPLEEVKAAATEIARRNGRPVFVTLAERGIVGVDPVGTVEHVPALPLRGPIDIVGAGDAVMANLAAALSVGLEIREAIELAAVASSIVIHQLGTTGTASVAELAELIDRIPST
jgi:fructose-1-phosphate kinase PfkB-like protein